MKATTAVLSDLCEIYSGGTPLRSNKKFYGGDIPWITIADMTESKGIVTESKEKITSDGLKAIRNVIFPAGTTLFAMYGSIGKIAVAGVDLSTNQAILGMQIKDKEKLNASYMRHWLSSIKNDLEKLSNGVTQKNLSATIVRGLKVPLPPLEEQKRIAAILDKADAIRRKRAESLRLLDDLLRATFLDMFGDPISNPKGWDRIELSEILTSLTSGSRGWATYYAENGSKFLRIQNVGKNELLLNEIAYVNAPKNAEAKRTKVNIGDILLSITADLGRTAVIPDNFGDGYINQHLAKFSIKYAEPLFISAYLASSGGQSQIAQKNKGGTKAGLNFDDIKSLKILLPPISLQKQYAVFWNKIQASKKQFGNHTHESNLLFHSLVARAFKGEL